jgi:leucyl aminopeptidase
MVESGEFKPELRKTRLIPLFERPKGMAPRRLLLVGLGEEEKFTLDALRGVAAASARSVRDLGLEGFSVELPSLANATPEARAQAWVEGALMGLYRMDAYKRREKEKDAKGPGTCLLLAGDPEEAEALRRGARRGEILAEATNFARDLVTHPGNVHTPSFLAREAQKLARREGMRCQVLSTRKAEALKMGAFLSVAQASATPAKFIVLEYPGRGRPGPPIVLMGKGVTFDTGGLDIKSSTGMRTMKTDMAGAAAVLGALQAISRLKLPTRVVGLLPCTENMVSGKANRPGDVVTSMAGITIEIDNTDAEGRLLLCDALAYARRYKSAAVIDLATLTGSCVVALGEGCSGLLGNHEGLIERVRQAAGKTGDRVWQLPLWEEYFDLIKSDIADIKNTGGRWGGAITASAFLARFAEGFPWAHLDIAGPAWRDTDLPYTPKGASGVGVRLITELIAAWRPLKPAPPGNDR